jgi:serine/threonine-protein kinase RsbW
MARRFQEELQEMAQPQASFSAFVELRQSLPSQVEVISPFVDQLMRFIKRFPNGDGSELDIEIMIREALANAIIHGNHENPEKCLYVTSRCSQDGQVLITIRDQGQGFGNGALSDPATPENILSRNGRGIYLMRALMDEVHFEEGGTVVKMRKKRNVVATADKKSD